MEPDTLTRFYAEVAKNLSHSWLKAGSTVFAANRRLTDAARGWGDEARAAVEVLTRATRRSREETRDVCAIVEEAPDGASLARFGDLVRAQTFLWTTANLSAAERLGRAASARGETLPGFAPGFSELVASAPSPRVFVLGVVAMDLWVGYAALRARAVDARAAEGRRLGIAAPARSRARAGCRGGVGGNPDQGRPVRLVPPGPPPRTVHRAPLRAAGPRAAATVVRDGGCGGTRDRTPHKRGLRGVRKGACSLRLHRSGTPGPPIRRTPGGR